MHVKEPTTLLVKRAGRYPGVVEAQYKKINRKKMVGAALWLPQASGWPNPHFLNCMRTINLYKYKNTCTNINTNTRPMNYKQINNI